MSGKDSFKAEPPAEDELAQTEAGTEATENRVASAVSDIASMIGNNKGKLAAGAAAMLGLAVFYKWRETKLAKDDPEEYARLQRLKTAVGGSPTDPEDVAEPDEPK